MFGVVNHCPLLIQNHKVNLSTCKNDIAEIHLHFKRHSCLDIVKAQPGLFIINKWVYSDSIRKSKPEFPQIYQP